MIPEVHMSYTAFKYILEGKSVYHSGGELRTMMHWH